MSNAIPPYLLQPDASGYTYGSLDYNAKDDAFLIMAGAEVRELAKRVFPGCRTYEEEKIRFPATRRATGDLNWLMQRFPLQVKCPEVFGRLRQQAIEHALRRDSNLTLVAAKTPLAFRKPLYDFQEVGMTFLTTNGRTLLADDMGLGKSPQGLAAAVKLEAFPLVILTMANNVEQWQEMVGRFVDLPLTGQLVFGDEDDEARGARFCHQIHGRRPYDLPAKHIYILHYGLLADWHGALAELKPKALICDEIQELRHRETRKYEGAVELAQHVQYIWGLSGTPIYNYGDEIWAIANVLEYHCLGDRDSFLREWCDPMGNGKHMVRKPAALGEYLRREGLLLRRRKSDVRKDLPPKRRVVIPVKHDEECYNAMTASAAELAKRYDQIRKWSDRGQAKREIETETRRATGVSKAPFVAEYVRGLLEAGERVLLYAHHHEVHDILVRELAAYHPVEISGRQSKKDKKAAKAAFMSGKTNLIQMALRSTAGLDGLQERGTCVVFAELDWSPAVHSQNEDRLHRIGLDTTIAELMCYYLVTDTGMDETIQDALGMKVGQFIGIVGDEATTEEDEILANQAAERHMDKVIAKLKAAS